MALDVGCPGVTKERLVRHSYCWMIALVVAGLPCGALAGGAGAPSRPGRSSASESRSRGYLPIAEVGTWKRRNGAALSAAFGREGARQLQTSCRFDPAQGVVFWGTWENPGAGSGGLLAVARQLPPALAKNCLRAVPMSPYHSQLKTAQRAPEAGEGLSFMVPYGGKQVQCTLFVRHDKKQPWHLICADSAAGFLTADGGQNGTDPYSYSSETAEARDGADSLLLRDSLFFSRAMAEATEALLRADPEKLADVGENSHLRDTIRAVQKASGIVFHAQDWQTAALALTLKEKVLDGSIGKPLKVLQTLHNLFDHYLPSSMLAKISDRSGDQFWPEVNADGAVSAQGTRNTVLGRFLPLGDGPATTVSDGFAKEAVAHPLQTEHFAPHLQSVFATQKIAGVNNGNFSPGPAVFSKEAYQAAQTGNYGPILAEKATAREATLRAVAAHKDERDLGHLDVGSLGSDVPIFLMTGRMDPNQKGFDVFAQAIQRVLQSGIDARFVLTPSVGGDAGPWLEQLATLAKTFPGKVTVLPYRVSPDLYGALQRGATWGIMPSLYEPFGAAGEMEKGGTPPIARETGGLRDQVTRENGIPYLEGPGNLPPELAAQWKQLDMGEQWRAIQSAGTPEKRMSLWLYQAMVSALAGAMIHSVSTLHDPATYGAMLANSDSSAERFSWEKAAKEYFDVYGRR